MYRIDRIFYCGGVPTTSPSVEVEVGTSMHRIGRIFYCGGGVPTSSPSVEAEVGTSMHRIGRIFYCGSNIDAQDRQDMCLWWRANFFLFR
jgi:hypothetical protein